jgi:hypothetical protein
MKNSESIISGIFISRAYSELVEELKRSRISFNKFRTSTQKADIDLYV